MPRPGGGPEGGHPDKGGGLEEADADFYALDLSGEGPPPPPLPRQEAGRAQAPASAAGKASLKLKKQRPETMEAADFAAVAAEMVAACEAELDADPPPAGLRAARLHFEIARLSESSLGQPDKALEHYRQAFLESPQHLAAIRGARRGALADGEGAQALNLFEAELRVTADPEARVALTLEKGHLLEDQLSRPAEARAAFEQAASLEFAGAKPTVLKALSQRIRADEAWEDLAGVLEKSANTIVDDDRYRAAVFVQRAHLAATKELDNDRAAVFYEAALRLDPDSHAAVRALKMIYAEKGRWLDLVRTLTHEAEQLSDPRLQAQAWFSVANLHADRLDDSQGALEALEKALSASDAEPLVLEQLARRYAEAQRFEDLVGVLEKLVATKTDSSDRVALMHRLGQLYEMKLQDARRAVAWYREALAEAPTHVPTLFALETLARKHQSWEPLIEMWKREAEAAEDSERRAAAHARIADVYEAQLRDLDAAVEHHRWALASSPDYEVSFRALSRLFQATGRWRELAELFERAVDRAPSDHHAITWLFRIGGIFEDQLGEPQLAIHAYRRILSLDGSHLGALHALQQACERGERWAELVEALEMEAERTSDVAQIVALTHRAGEILADRVGDRDAALLHFQRALELDATFIPALSRLGKTYYHAGRWEDLLDIYDREIQAKSDSVERAALFHKMGELTETRLGDLERAMVCYRQAVEEDPGCRPALRSLARIALDRYDITELVRIRESELEAEQDPEARALLAFQVGEFCEEQLGDRERALAAYGKALEAVPDYRPAQGALARIKQAERDWAALAEDLSREAEATSDPTLALSAMVRHGEILLDELGDAEGAIAVFEEVLRRDEGQVTALVLLEPLYRDAERWDALASNYRRQADVLSDPAAQAAALRELARLASAGRVEMDADERQGILESILELAPDDPAALTELESLALETGRVELLRRVDEGWTRHTRDPVALGAYKTRLGESLERMGLTAAIDAYQEALEEDPESLGAARGMVRVARQLDDAAGLAQALGALARLERSPERAAELWVQSAALRDDRLGDRARAISELEQALELDPAQVEAAERLEEALLATGAAGRLANVLLQAAGRCKVPERTLALGLSVARIQADKLGNLAEAMRVLSRTLKLAPDHLDALTMMGALCAKGGQAEGAAAAYGKVLELSDDQARILQARLELARLYGGPLKDRGAAMAHLEAALELDPRHHGALEQLAELQVKAGQLDGASKTMRRMVEGAQSAEERVTVLLRLAAMERRLERFEESAQALAGAVAIEGPGGRAAKAYLQTLSRGGSWEAYASAVMAHFKALEKEGRAPRVEGILELSRVQWDRLKRQDDAIATLRKGLELQPKADPMRVELVARLRQSGQLEPALGELFVLIRRDPSRADAWRQLAIVMGKLGRRDEARLALEPLVIMQEADAKEREVWEGRQIRPGHARPRSYGRPLLEAFALKAPGWAEAGELLSVVAAGELGKLFPPELDPWGVSARHILNNKSDHPLRQLADPLADLFGIDDYDLALHRHPRRLVAAELTEPATLLLPNWTPELTDAGQVFLIAWAMAYLARGLHPVFKLGARNLELLLAAAARTATPGFGEGLSSEEFLEDHAKKVQRVVPRRLRKELQEAAARYAAAPRCDLAQWTQAVHQDAMGLGLLLADDLRACVEVVRKVERDLSEVAPADLIRRSPRVAELYRQWASPRALAHRRKAGQVVAGVAHW